MNQPTQNATPEGFSEEELAGWRTGRLFARPAPTVGAAPPSGRAESVGGDAGAPDPDEPVLFVPEPLPAGPLGLVVLLHGARSTPADVLPLLEDQAQRGAFLLLAPKSIDYTWDVIVDGGFGPDVAALDSALVEVFAQFEVDPDRIAVAGISDGASYALSLGLANGSLFTRVLAFSPGYFAQGHREGRPKIFISHGREDRVLPIDRTSWKIVSVLTRAGYPVDFREFTGGHEAPADVVELAARTLRP
jgi:phospholipase/carboxylesterase